MSNYRPNPPCGPCQREGGWRMIVAGLEVGDLQPPRESCPPFTGYQPDWTLEPMCSSHARIVNETRLTAQLTSKVVSSRP